MSKSYLKLKSDPVLQRLHAMALHGKQMIENDRVRRKIDEDFVSA